MVAAIAAVTAWRTLRVAVVRRAFMRGTILLRTFALVTVV